MPMTPSACSQPLQQVALPYRLSLGLRGRPPPSHQCRAYLGLTTLPT